MKNIPRKTFSILGSGEYITDHEVYDLFRFVLISLFHQNNKVKETQLFSYFPDIGQIDKEEFRRS